MEWKEGESTQETMALREQVCDIYHILVDKGEDVRQPAKQLETNLKNDTKLRLIGGPSKRRRDDPNQHDWLHVIYERPDGSWTLEIRTVRLADNDMVPSHIELTEVYIHTDIALIEDTERGWSHPVDNFPTQGGVLQPKEPLKPYKDVKYTCERPLTREARAEIRSRLSFVQKQLVERS